MRITTKQKELVQPEEEDDKRDFPMSYLEVEEENRKISEHKAPELMEAKIKIK